MEKRKIFTVIFMLIVLMVLTIIFTALDNFHNIRSVYELGRSTGLMYKKVLENLITFITIWLVYKNFRENNRIQNFAMLLVAVLVLSIIFSVMYKPTISANAYQKGYSVGLVYKNILKTTIMANVLVVIFQKTNINQSRS
jgi:hypothetical protein